MRVSVALNPVAGTVRSWLSWASPNLKHRAGRPFHLADRPPLAGPSVAPPPSPERGACASSSAGLVASPRRALARRVASRPPTLSPGCCASGVGPCAVACLRCGSRTLPPSCRLPVAPEAPGLPQAVGPPGSLEVFAAPLSGLGAALTPRRAVARARWMASCGLGPHVLSCRARRWRRSAGRPRCAAPRASLDRAAGLRACRSSTASLPAGAHRGASGVAPPPALHLASPVLDLRARSRGCPRCLTRSCLWDVSTRAASPQPSGPR